MTYNPEAGSGSGTVTSVSVTTANGVSGSVATATTTPAITLTLGAIAPSSVAASGTVTGSNLSGTNTGDVANTAITTNPLSQFAATTSAQLRGVLSDESGTGAAYFQGGDLGTPSAGVATNLTGTASGLTAGAATNGMVTNAANTMGASGTINASAQATGTLRVPNVAGGAPTTAGAVEYDTTQGALKTGTYQSQTATVTTLLYSAYSTTDTLTASVQGTTETAFATTYTVPGNYLIAGKKLRITMSFQQVGAGTAVSFVIKLRATNASGTILYETSSFTFASGTIGAPGIGLTLAGTAAAGASVNTITSVIGVATVGGNARNNIAQPVALPTNAAIVLVPTCDFSANTAGYNLTLLGLEVEALN